RITIPEIKMHPWFLNKLPMEFVEEGKNNKLENDVNGVVDSSQSIEEIQSIIQEARKPGEGPKIDGQFVGGGMDFDEMDADDDFDDDIETSGDFDFVCDM
ncbi:serine/threonine-protein kinase SAPK2-like, partial [Trifolium medium]|nr:serine/threonine-protein kinase SAPK2-like [Trifolium medium]MCI08637.1 serine/threonine-protein kinase SAPK2-like [Trifolium medium]